MMVNAVIVAGTDTTRNQLGCAVALFAEHPDQWALLAERPELAPRAVEETMRYFGAVRGTARFASVRHRVPRRRVPGRHVHRRSASPRRTARPTASPSPTVFDITSPAPAHPQLTFGSGIHYCLGAALARAELQEALPLLAQRMPNLRSTARSRGSPTVSASSAPRACRSPSRPGTDHRGQGTEARVHHRLLGQRSAGGRARRDPGGRAARLHLGVDRRGVRQRRADAARVVGRAHRDRSSSAPASCR